MKRYLSLLLFFILIVHACHGQTKEEMEATVNSLLGNLYKEVQYQDESINYQMQITIGGCGFEVLVNDLSVYRNADPGNGELGGSISLNKGINNNILKSGLQTWEVRVYPISNIVFRLDTLSENTSLTICINAVRYHDKGITKLVEPIYLLETPLVEKGGKLVYADAGKPMMVYKGTFEAKVPYELVGWSKSRDLRRMDQDKLLEMLLNEYRLLGNDIKRGEISRIAEALKKSYSDRAQYLFFTKEDNEIQIDQFNELYNRSDFKVYPLENYKMTFWGDGRMVTLERTDYKFNAALITEFPIMRGKKEDIENFSYNLFFHIPEGSDQLEIIR